MQITRNTMETGRGPEDWFTGAVFVDTIASPSSGSRIGAAAVHFTPGARTAWHTHNLTGRRSGSPRGSVSASARAVRSGDPAR